MMWRISKGSMSDFKSIKTCHSGYIFIKLMVKETLENVGINYSTHDLICEAMDIKLFQKGTRSHAKMCFSDYDFEN